MSRILYILKIYKMLPFRNLFMGWPQYIWLIDWFFDYICVCFQSSSNSLAVKSRTAPDPDQELFEFLNSSEVPAVSKTDSRPSSVISSRNRRTPEGLLFIFQLFLALVSNN